MPITYAWRGAFDNLALNELHAEGFEHKVLDDDWRVQLERHSLGWVCAYESGDGGEGEDSLVGFVNVAWDGAVHAFVLDTLVSAHARRRGIAKELIAIAQREAREAGCEWLHVDFEDHLRDFYFDACGFVPTNAGLISL
jgi:ribosomal protein S18 acetylase RimI-like enzyme